jgi:dTDP-4-dehydrorhamnose reductase
LTLQGIALAPRFVMTQSFTANEENSLAESIDKPNRRVLVTGAPGNIGSYFAEHSHQQYDLRLMVQKMEDAKKIAAFGEVVQGDLGDLEKLKELCAGMDSVVHLAGDASPSAVWKSVLHNNIIGTYNLFVAAKAAGCRRVIYASSIHAVSGYPVDVQVKTNEPVNPGDLYGVSKCFGEAMGRYMAEQENLSVIAIRIGSFQPAEAARQEKSFFMMDAWVSQRDLTQLIQKCIETKNIRFAIFHGLSDNSFKRLDISDARELVGYEPQDDLTRENPKLKNLKLEHAIPAHAQEDGEKSGIREEL